MFVLNCLFLELNQYRRYSDVFSQMGQSVSAAVTSALVPSAKQPTASTAFRSVPAFAETATSEKWFGDCEFPNDLILLIGAYVCSTGP